MLFNLVLKHLLPSCLSGYLTPVYLLTLLRLPLTHRRPWPLGRCVCVCVFSTVSVLNSILLEEWAWFSSVERFFFLTVPVMIGAQWFGREQIHF